MKRRSIGLLAVLLPAVGWAQAPAVVRSPEVQSDGRVSFRFRAPQAREVLLAREGAERLPMSRGEDGVWMLTTAPLDPDLYGYSFVVDGVRVIDPSNALMKPNLLATESLVHVPGPPSLLWELADVPRGTVHRHFYRSAVVGDERDYFVYTPPGYDPASRTEYPVLYLLHGYSDDASAWTAVGRAHVILDNLIARGAAKPMLVVMPLGYGDLGLLAGWHVIGDQALRKRSFERYREALFSETMPAVERGYRVSRGRENTAIAGLSMGGAQSLYFGLNAPDRFSWIGAFSAGGMFGDHAAAFPQFLEGAVTQPRLLWLACGTEDRLIEANRALVKWLAERKVRHEWKETPGGHVWMLWRRNLAEFVTRLFR